MGRKRKRFLLLGFLLACGRSPSTMSLSGQVIDHLGKPLPQAAVSGAWGAVLTDDRGRFALPAEEAGRATIAASGFLSVSQWLKPEATIQLQPRSVRRLVIDLSHQPLGGLGSLFDGLSTLWRHTGFRVELCDRFPDLSEVEVLVVAAPRWVYAEGQREAIARFVQAGGKLVLLGEWGGFGGYDPDGFNQLAKLFGIRFNHDLIRGPEGSHVQARHWSDHPLAPSRAGISLWGATSLTVQPPAEAIAFADGFRVAQSERPAVVAVALYGAGRVIAVGDSSLWTGVTDGTMPLLEADNRQWAQTVVTW